MFYPFDFKYHIIRPDSSGSIPDQINDCLEMVKLYIGQQGEDEKIIRINWFFKATRDLDCEKLKEDIEKAGFITEIKLNSLIIAQAPTDGSDLQLLITSLEGIPAKAFINKYLSGIHYASVNYKNGHWIFMNASGCSSSDQSIKKSAEKSFTEVMEVLKGENLGFKNILRQWNYIPQITGTYADQDGLKQNYQEFNEVRAGWYANNGLKEDYPAATGIGTSGKVVRLEIIASNNEGGPFDVFSIQNPDQQNAHQYSKEKWKELFTALSENQDIDDLDFKQVPMSGPSTYK